MMHRKGLQNWCFALLSLSPLLWRAAVNGFSTRTKLCRHSSSRWRTAISQQRELQYDPLFATLLHGKCRRRTSRKSSKNTPVTKSKPDNNNVKDDVRHVYLSWCKEFDMKAKRKSSPRYKTFVDNYMKLVAYEETTGKKMSLTPYADYTPEEYRTMVKEKTADETDNVDLEETAGYDVEDSSIEENESDLANQDTLKPSGELETRLVHDDSESDSDNKPSTTTNNATITDLGETNVISRVEENSKSISSKNKEEEEEHDKAKSRGMETPESLVATKEKVAENVVVQSATSSRSLTLEEQAIASAKEEAKIEAKILAKVRALEEEEARRRMPPETPAKKSALSSILSLFRSTNWRATKPVRKNRSSNQKSVILPPKLKGKASNKISNNIAKPEKTELKFKVTSSSNNDTNRIQIPTIELEVPTMKVPTLDIGVSKLVDAYVADVEENADFEEAVVKKKKSTPSTNVFTPFLSWFSTPKSVKPSPPKSPPSAGVRLSQSKIMQKSSTVPGDVPTHNVFSFLPQLGKKKTTTYAKVHGHATIVSQDKPSKQRREVTSTIRPTSSKSQSKTLSSSTVSHFPILKNFIQTKDGRIKGILFNSSRLKDGSPITTSPTRMGVKKGDLVTTSSGNIYRLQ